MAPLVQSHFLQPSSAPLEAGPEMVDQRIDHIFFRPGREDQQVLVEGVYLAGDPVDGVYPPTTERSSGPTVARLTRHC